MSDVRGVAPLVRATGLSATFEDWPLFTDLSFEVAAGQCLVLTGENDIARTALLECLAGRRESAAGEFAVAGPLVALWHEDGFAEDDAIEESVAAALREAGCGRDAVELIEGLGLGHRVGHEPWAMSQGERRRIALELAFVLPKSVLLLDEPERRLDAGGVRWLIERVREQLDVGVAVMLATHNDDLVADLADAYLILD